MHVIVGKCVPGAAGRCRMHQSRTVIRHRRPIDAGRGGIGLAGVGQEGAAIQPWRTARGEITHDVVAGDEGRHAAIEDGVAGPCQAIWNQAADVLLLPGGGVQRQTQRQ